MGNIIPATTGAAQAVVKVLPELKGKFHGKWPPSRCFPFFADQQVSQSEYLSPTYHWSTLLSDSKHPSRQKKNS